MGNTVMVLGGGGREHALIWKISQSPKVEKIFSIPGNAGIEDEPKVQIVQMGLNDLEKLSSFALDQRVGLTVVGPEAPLVAGIVDEFERRGLRAVGPTQKAAMLEGSKIFAKNFMRRCGIPTADFQIFTPCEMKEAIDFCYRHLPAAVKVDKLAAGKGVILVRSEEEAADAIGRIFVKKEFGETDILIEECLFGEEATYMIFTDGKHVVPMLSTQDHKPIYDDDKGPNTGGMGAYAPTPVIDKAMEVSIFKSIIEPMVRGFLRENIFYRGILYIGLMITKDGPKVLEFNCRFGDPECQPLIMLLETDIMDIFEAILAGNLNSVKVEWNPGAAVSVVMASEGYPGEYKTGYSIAGLDVVKKWEHVKVFHAGTKRDNELIRTAGGRVLSVTATSSTIAGAKSRAYYSLTNIGWQGEYHRADIAEKALKHLQERV